MSISLRDDERNIKYHLVKWDKMKNPVSRGGLGLRSLVDLNRALQEKWL